jgi:hypothetical protein
VYVVGASLPVVVGLNEPHAVPPQLTVHVTCGFADTSFAIVAPSWSCALTASEAGGVPSVTVIGIGGTIVIVADLEREGFTADVAVNVTAAPEGIAAGAV